MKSRSIPLQNEEAPLRSGVARRRRNPSQPALALDPMPERVEPCLALLKGTPPTGPDWSFEVKWDGYRLAIHIEPSGVRILTRGGHDWTHRFPGIAEAARELGPATAIIDGEAVVLDEQGRSDFGLLQKALGGRGGKKIATDAVLYAFDLMYFDGHDLRNVEQSSRRHMLHDLIGAEDGVLRYSDDIDGDPTNFLAAACSLGLEGIIAKHRERPYRSGRQGDWLKIKCIQSDSFAIVGYEPSLAMPGAFSSLLLAATHNGSYVYVGNVGTGFGRDEAKALRRQLDKHKTSAPAIQATSKKLVMIEPRMVAEIEYRGWTRDGKLRHASLKGVRETDDAANVMQIDVFPMT